MRLQSPVVPVNRGLPDGAAADPKRSATTHDIRTMSTETKSSDAPGRISIPEHIVAEAASNREISTTELAHLTATVEAEAAQRADSLYYRLTDDEGSKTTTVDEFGLLFIEVTDREWYLFAEVCGLDTMERRIVREVIWRAAQEAGEPMAVLRRYIVIPLDALDVTSRRWCSECEESHGDWEPLRGTPHCVRCGTKHQAGSNEDQREHRYGDD